MAFGDHLVSPRRGYDHHGIDVGFGWVVHYSGWARGGESGPVELVSRETFSGERPVRVLPRTGHRHSRLRTVWRALRRLGEDEYCVLTNNCEHFVYYAKAGEPRSLQIERVGVAGRALLTGIVAVLEFSRR